MEHVMDLDEASQYLRLSKASLYKYARGGAVPGFKIGRTWRFHKETLDKWMAEKTGREMEERSSKGAR